MDKTAGLKEKSFCKTNNNVSDEMYQVNISENVNGDTVAWVSKYNPDGYCGVVVEKVYSDGSDTTDWNVYNGTKKECDKYAEKINSER